MRGVKGVLLASLFGVFFGGVVMGNQGEISESQSGPVLGSDTFEERELAADELWGKGEKALNLLNAMATSDDPEQSWRARQILRWVDLEMTPETPHEVVKLVETYLTASSAQEREKIYIKLLEQEAYVQLFRLPGHVSDEVVARNLAERVAQLAGQVAVRKVLAGDDEEALAILADAKKAKNGKNSKAGNLRWVALASALGKREELWDGLSADDKMRFARWEGNVELIRSLASEEHEVQVSLQLLDGNVLPYLDARARRKDSQGLRAQMAKAHWFGQQESEKNRKIVDSFVAAIKENGVEESKDALILLIQLGYVEEALPFFEKEFPMEMFEYYEGIERLEDAFRMLGLKVGEPVPDAWIEDALGQVGVEFNLKNKGCRRLLGFGQFLVERGELEEAEKLFNALYVAMDNLGEEGINEVNSLLAYLGGRQESLTTRGFPELAIQKAMEREEDVFEPESFLSEAFFANESSFLMYRFLEERAVNMSDWQRVRAVFAAFGRRVDFPEEELKTILAELELSAETNASEAEWTVLRQCAIYLGDMELLERSTRAMVELVDEKAVARTDLATLLFSDGRLEEASELLLKLLEDDPNRFDLMESVAVVLEASGKEEEAQELLLMLEKLALGDGSWLVSLGRIWGELGQWEKRHELFERAFLLLPSNSERWVIHLYSLADSALKVGDWMQAAACWEVYNNSALGFDLYGRTDGFNLGPYLGLRGKVEFARAMAAFEARDMEEGDRILERLVSYGGFDSSFANEIFPALRQAGLHEQVEGIWAGVSPSYRHSMKAYPDGHNAYNTAAWVASRAACDLDEALLWVDEALERQPNSSAYRDTRGEVLFAQEKREEALMWSEKACKKTEGSSWQEVMMKLSALRVQYRHFRDDPFPLAGVEQGPME